MKRVPIRDESELDDYMVEIDILTECRHKNIVGLYEAYFYDQALWVSHSLSEHVYNCVAAAITRSYKNCC